MLLCVSIEFTQGMILPAKDSASDLTKLDSDKSSKVCMMNNYIEVNSRDIILQYKKSIEVQTDYGKILHSSLGPELAALPCIGTWNMGG